MIHREKLTKEQREELEMYETRKMCMQLAEEIYKQKAIFETFRIDPPTGSHGRTIEIMVVNAK